jgi:hypothetical protein
MFLRMSVPDPKRSNAKVRSVPEGGINEILACPADAERMTRIITGLGDDGRVRY